MPDDGAKAARKRVTSEFPKHTLEESLRVAQAVEDANGGNPYPPTDVAIALGISPGSSDWRSLSSAAIKYGLTTGSYKSERISLTSLAVRIVSPTSEEDRAAALFEAALMPTTFRSIFDHFKNKKLPAEQFLHNTIAREFGVPKEHAATCGEIFTSNAMFIGLTRTTATGPWLGTEPSRIAGLVSVSPPDEMSDEDVDDGGQDPDPTEDFPRGDQVPPPPAPPSGRDNAVFVGHGKNKKPLEQLQKILNEYSIPFKVAVDEPNRGRPISEKVAQVMGQCGAGVLIFTADEEFRTVDGNVVWRPSENVVYELGAASILYGGRIIIFKEKGVTFPSNFREIGYIEFDKDALDAKGIEFFRELIAFKIIQVSVPT